MSVIPSPELNPDGAVAPEDDRYLTARQVRRRYGDASDMWLWRRLKDNSGFKPIEISGRRFWKLSALFAWERSQLGRRLHRGGGT
jgi:hypothetical protein